MSSFEEIFTNLNYKKDYFEERIGKRNLISYQQDLNFVLKNLNHGDKVLDYGCGEMIFTKFLDKEFETFVFDLSPYIIKKEEYLERQQYNSKQQYDGIILRGVLQHLPDPFLTLRKLSEQLKNNGKIIFLATPNTSSPYYFLNADLPPLNPEINFWVPSIIELKKNMKNLGLKKYKLQYPYIGSGYENIFKDHILFLLNIFGKKSKYAFWKSMMNVSFVKCTDI